MNSHHHTIFLVLLFLIAGNLTAQVNEGEIQNTLLLKGQISAWGHFNPDNTLPLWSGARYIPQINYEIKFRENKMLDFEASSNFFGSLGLNPFDSTSVNWKVKPYRFWARYSSKQFEIRAGLQKINFGSASLLRPLMWFDQVDPRDPLRLTDGVWAVLARYYFLNNINIWMWGLYGNKNPKGWEAIPTAKNKPEFGGRIQMPVPRGEAAFTYHHRKTNEYDSSDLLTNTPEIPENRIAFDTKLDIVVGFWLEAAWINQKGNSGVFTNQEIINLGVDYTFGIGNGLTVIYEQLIASYDEKAFNFKNTVSFSLVNLTYPVGLFDNLNAIVYYDWTSNSAYNFISWQKQFNKTSLYVMGYANPKNYNIPTQGTGENLFAGNGIQIMLVFNH